MYRSNNKALIAVLLELIGGYIGLLGLGWMFGGDLLRGFLILIGYIILLSVGGFLVTITFGILAIVFVPVYLVVPIISAFKVHEFMTNRWW